MVSFYGQKVWKVLKFTQRGGNADSQRNVYKWTETSKKSWKKYGWCRALGTCLKIKQRSQNGGIQGRVCGVRWRQYRRNYIRIKRQSGIRVFSRVRQSWVPRSLYCRGAQTVRALTWTSAPVTGFVITAKVRTHCPASSQVMTLWLIITYSKTKRHSMYWKHTTATVTKRFRSWPSDGKLMLTVFGDSWGLICEHCPWTEVHVGTGYSDMLWHELWPATDDNTHTTTKWRTLCDLSTTKHLLFRRL